MVNEDIEFREEGEYVGEQKYSIKEIILRHIRKISDLCCQEFTGSYWEKKPIKTSSGIMFSEVYHDDKREAYCNAVDFLIDVVYPMSDKKLKEYLTKYEGYKEEITDDKVEEEKLDIKEKIKKKRITFRQINLMFENTNFWKGTESYNE
jgi:hypothetical protein